MAVPLEKHGNQVSRVAMLTPQRLLRAIIEVLFVLLGGLVIWLGLSNQIFFDRRRPSWLILSVAIILWGLRALYRPGVGPSPVERWTRGLSLVLLGAVMLAMSRVRFEWAGPLVATGGLILGARGLVSLVLLLRPTSHRAS
jgi:predicted membrane protein